MVNEDRSEFLDSTFLVEGYVVWVGKHLPVLPRHATRNKCQV
jgi:hypothetical protein